MDEWGALQATIIGLVILISLWLGWFFRPEITRWGLDLCARIAPALSTLFERTPAAESPPAAPAAAHTDPSVMSNGHASSHDLTPVLLTILALQTRKSAEEAGREAQKNSGRCDHLHITETKLSAGQLAYVRQFVASGRNPLTIDSQAKMAEIMGKGDKAITDAVRVVAQQIADEAAEAERRRVAALPVPPAIATMVPLPPELLEPA